MHLIFGLINLVGCEAAWWDSGVPGDTGDAAASDGGGTGAGTDGGGSTGTGADDGGSGDPSHREEAEGYFTTTNSVGRTGAYFLPAGDIADPLFLVVAFHGSGGGGGGMIAPFRDLARTHGFALVAPDSRVDPGGNFNWEVGTKPGEVTEDLTHAQACMAELQARGDWSLDSEDVLAMGFSGGGSSAPYLGTNDPLFTGFAVLHGGSFPGGFGDNIIPGWYSTGEDDEARSPAFVQAEVAAAEAAGFTDITYTTFPGGHTMGQAELEAMVQWWLD
jgi:predicted esterase